MDPLTIFIAQLAGPAILAVGLGIFFSPSYYGKVYRNLQNETLGVFMGGLTILVAGIAIIINHNLWDSFAAGAVTFIGWASIAKGLALIIVPNTVDKFGDIMADSKAFPYLAVLAAGVGACISYFAYFM